VAEISDIRLWIVTEEGVSHVGAVRSIFNLSLCEKPFDPGPMKRKPTESICPDCLRILSAATCTRTRRKRYPNRTPKMF
jgi:hypothetical protein